MHGAAGARFHEAETHGTGACMCLPKSVEWQQGKHRQHLPPNGSKQCFICALRARPAWCAHLSGNHLRSSWRCSNSSSSSIFISMITIGHDHRSPAPKKPTLNPKALTPRSIAGACSYSHACAAQQSASPVNSSAFDEAAGNHHFGKLVRSSPGSGPDSFLRQRPHPHPLRGQVLLLDMLAPGHTTQTQGVLFWSLLSL